MYKVPYYPYKAPMPYKAPCPNKRPPMFFPIIPEVAPNKHPPLHLWLGLFALVDAPIMPINHWKLDPRHKYLICIYGDRSHDFTVSSDVFQHLNKCPPKMTYISALDA